jgi:hypothetical protein
VARFLKAHFHTAGMQDRYLCHHRETGRKRFDYELSGSERVLSRPSQHKSGG